MMSERNKTTELTDVVILVDFNGKIEDQVLELFSDHPFFDLVVSKNFTDAYMQVLNNQQRLTTAVIYCSENIKEEVFKFIEFVKEKDNQVMIVMVSEDDSLVRDKRVIELSIDDLIGYPFKPKFFMHKIIINLSRREKLRKNLESVQECIKVDYMEQIEDIHKKLCQIKAKGISNGRTG